MNKRERMEKERDLDRRGIKILRAQYRAEHHGYKIVYHTQAGGWKILESYKNMVYDFPQDCEDIIDSISKSNPDLYYDERRLYDE